MKYFILMSLLFGLISCSGGSSGSKKKNEVFVIQGLSGDDHDPKACPADLAGRYCSADDVCYNLGLSELNGSLVLGGIFDNLITVDGRVHTGSSDGERGRYLGVCKDGVLMVSAESNSGDSTYRLEIYETESIDKVRIIEEYFRDNSMNYYEGFYSR